MEAVYYVSTDALGVESDGDHETRYELASDASRGESSPDHGPALLYAAHALIERLDEVIFVAEATGTATEVGDGVLRAEGATLVRRTAWDTVAAARLALDCVTHVLGDSADVTLPGGATLADVVAEANGFLAGTRDSDGRIARLSRLATARRLRRQGELVGDVARGLLVEDLGKDLDAVEDPAWTLAASLADAVFSAVEALRHVALGRYAAEREEVAGEQEETAADATVPRFVNWLPWGQIAIGAEHQSSYRPASHLARDAAMRARETVAQRDGNGAAAAELEWQATLLTGVLEGS